MDIRLWYEAGLILFWLLFAYLVMDKFLFKGRLGEICFGGLRRRTAIFLRSVAGWFDPVKEERKKGRRRTKEKTEKKEVPVVKVVEQAEIRTKEKKVRKEGETDALVITKSYGTRQYPPTAATRSEAIAGNKNASTFADGNPKTASSKAMQVSPENIPDLFRDKRVEEWRAASGGTSGKRDDSGETGSGNDVDTDELNEELEDLNCAREDYDGVSGIGTEEMDLIIDLCNGKDIPASKRLALLRAIHHIKDTQIERSLLESINGSDSRISKFLDNAEKVSEADPGSD